MATVTARKKRAKKSEEKQFAWREGSRFSVDAQEAGEELARIAKANNTDLPNIPAQVLVDESREEEAPLHPAFTWDDWVAAEAHRREEARQIIRSVRVIEEDSGKVSAAPTWVRVILEETKESTYVETKTAWSHEYMKRQVLAEAIGAFRALKLRYENLSESLGEVFAAIDRLPDSK